MNLIDTSQWMVCVHCPTYNHAPYIKGALGGFCLQDTNFPYVCVVVDDFSTDGEQTILKDYLAEHFELKKNALNIPNETDDYLMTFARHKKNQNCHIALYLLKYNHGHMKPRGPYYKKWDEDSKYIAICEGDDYWTDHKKLQKQVDYLNTHSLYSAITSNAYYISSDGVKMGPFSNQPSRDIDKMGGLVRERAFHTASIMYRRELREVPCWKNAETKWDTYTWCCLLTLGPIGYEDEITCVYRLGTGVTTTTSKLKWILLQEKWANILYQTFSPQYITYNDAYRPLLQDVFSVMVNDNISADDRERARVLFKRYITLSLCLEMCPWFFRHYASKTKSILIHLIQKGK